MFEFYFDSKNVFPVSSCRLQVSGSVALSLHLAAVGRTDAVRGFYVLCKVGLRGRYCLYSCSIKFCLLSF